VVDKVETALCFRKVWVKVCKVLSKETDLAEEMV